MRNWDLREFRVRVNLLLLIQQVWLPIQPVITPIQGLLNPIRQVLPLISHIHSYSPYCFYLYLTSLFLVHNPTIIAEHKVKSSLSISMPWSWVNTVYSLHQVQHTPSTASTQDYLSSLHSHNYNLTPESSCSFRRASLQHQLPPASSPWEPKDRVTPSHSHGCELTNWWIEFHQHPARLPSTTSKFSNLTRL